MIVQPVVEPMDRFAALLLSNDMLSWPGVGLRDADLHDPGPRPAPAQLPHGGRLHRGAAGGAAGRALRGDQPRDPPLPRPGLRPHVHSPHTGAGIACFDILIIRFQPLPPGTEDLSYIPL